MKKKFKNLYVELSEIEQDILLEFCIAYKIPPPEECIEGNGKRYLIVRDMGIDLFKIRVSFEETGLRSLVLDIICMPENGQKTVIINNPDQLVKSLLHLKEIIF